ncbi:MAG: hypothetical protein RSE28_09030 [Acinetobacter sp.]
MSIQQNESLGFIRVMMVLSSFSPLFILWALRGNQEVSDLYLIPFCVLFIIVPNLFLWRRINIAKKQNDKRIIKVGTADDHKDHILVYLFATLLPFYSVGIESLRDIGTTLVALIFVIFLFLHLNLHYMNILFAMKGYRIFTICPPEDNNSISGKTPQVLITKRAIVLNGDEIVAYRLSNTVFLEI